MISLDHERKFKNSWLISPGVVGSVGDVLPVNRIRQSMPEMPVTWDEEFAGDSESYLGANVQDGNSRSFFTGGRNATTYDSNWSNKKFKTNYGWKFQDLRAPDKLHEPINVGIPQYSYNNRIASIFHSRVTGNNFLPLPNGFSSSTGIPRGGMVPTIVSTEQGSVLPLSTFGYQTPAQDSTEAARFAMNKQRLFGPRIV